MANTINDGTSGKVKKYLKVLIMVIAVIAIVAAAYLFISKKMSSSSSSDLKQRTAKVTVGNIDVIVSGSGPVDSVNGVNLYSNVSSHITKMYHKDGDYVKKGEPIMDFSTFDPQINMNDQRNSLSQTMVTYNNAVKNLKYTKIYATANGEISALTIKEGDQVSAGQTIATITDKSNYKLVLPFINKYRKQLRPGMVVSVNTFDTVLENSNAVTGKITYVGPASYKTSDGSEGYNVEIQIPNTGAMKDGLVANGTITEGGNKLTSSDSGTLSAGSTVTIKSQISGTVEKIYGDNGQLIGKGKLLVQLQSDQAQNDLQTAQLKIASIKNQMQTVQKQLSDCRIIAPISGMLSIADATNLQDVSSGEGLKVNDSIKSGQEVASIVDSSNMEFRVDIDELDIAKIKVGQKVKVSVDALPDTTNRPLNGVVSKIAVLGSSNNGVTTYPVSIKILDTDGLKCGMNANGTIQISSKRNVLVVPIEAVQKRGQRSTVWVKKAGTSSDKTAAVSANNSGSSKKKGSSGNWGGNGSGSSFGGGSASGSNNFMARMMANNPELAKYYAGAEMKRITTGISNEDYIEITDGLQEGDTVILPPVYSNSSSNSNNNNQNRSGIGGMGGGFGGGFSGGGNRNSGGNGGSRSK